MSDWQPIETAPTGVPVRLGGWGPDYSRSFVLRDALVPELTWCEGAGLAYVLNERAIRVRKCDCWVQWWKPFDFTPPPQEIEA